MRFHSSKIREVRVLFKENKDPGETRLKKREEKKTRQNRLLKNGTGSWKRRMNKDLTPTS